MRDLKYEDFEDIEEDPSWSGLDCLAIVAKRAAELYDHREKFQEILMEKKKKKPLLIGVQSKISSKPKEVYMKPSVSSGRLVLKISSKNGVQMNGAAKPLSREEILKREKLLKRPIEDDCLVKKKEMLMHDDTELPREEILKRERLLKRPIIEENCVVKKKEMLMHDDTAEPVLPREEILKRERLLKRPMEEEEENFAVKQKRIKRSKKKVKPDHHGLNGQVMSIEFKNRILELAKGKHVSEEKLVIQKKLSATDCSKGHNRFTIPKNQVVQDFLTDEEEAELCLHHGSEMRSMAVRLIEPSLQHCTLCLRRWNLKKRGESSSVSFVLNGPNWNVIRTNNGLEVGMIVQLWAVRVEEELWLVLVRVPKECEHSVGVGGSHENASSSNSNQQ